ncbi:DUF4382 domain-containing protein [soil metagenome]
MVAMVGALIGCGGGGNGGGGGIGGTGAPLDVGTVRFALTDAPSCGYDQVNITIDRIRLHQDSGAGDGDGGWSEIVLQPPKRVDLLTLTNGALAELGQATVPVGTYRQLRLVLAVNGNAVPPPNSVVPTGGSETALSTPSAQQSGLKLSTEIVVADNALTDLVLDFDACKSVVKAGASGRYNLKPVITVLARAAGSGNRVVGYLAAPLASSATSVSLQANGVPIKATAPDASGQFVLYPVPGGDYDLVVSSPNRVLAVVTGVPVTATASTSVSTAAIPIAPPLLTIPARTVSGVVTNPLATVRSLQTLQGGQAVEVAWAPVDATTGAFSFVLPANSAVRSAYVAGAPGATFVVDPLPAGRYTVDAAIGSTHASQLIDVTGAVPPLTLALPLATQ